jgi:uncharacterized membrane protein YbhN (UPF0104 family)
LSKPSVEHPPPSPLRRWLLLAARILVSVALLAILFRRMDTGALWSGAKHASAPWLLVALALYFGSVLASTWRWRLLLDAQGVHVPRTTLLSSYLVANFFNNFLPSNIGGDVVRISDTAGRARSKTLATTVVLVDRGLGLLGLVLIAALGATVVGRLQGHEPSPIWPSWLWASLLVAAAVAAPAVMAPAGFGRLLRPLSVLHPTWVGERIEKLTSALARFRDRPGALAGCFVGAVLVQAILIAYHLAVVHALHVPVGVWDLAVIVPISFVVQMVPVSLNGLGVREAAFSFYFTRLGLPIQSGVLVSLGATVLMIIYMSRGSRQ